MKTYRSTLRTMRLAILVCQLGLILKSEAQIPEACILSNTNRPPENSDITVICGTEYMDLSIFLCPVYQALYNESLMVLNAQLNNPECFGNADWDASPPVLNFRFPLNENAASSCNNNYKTISQVGTGEFSDFSDVQYINISGTVTSIDPSAGKITYRPQILYKFSCFYPMQYLLNNTEVAVSGVSLAIRDNNGSFISTLRMHLYQDEQYSIKLNIPQAGLNLKTKIYVAVKATNLTEKFNVLLVRCYATTGPYPTSLLSTYYDLFVGCDRDAQTKVDLNGESQVAHFSFEAFRFVEHKNQTVSIFYLHCITRLCEVSTCSSLKPDCSNTQTRRSRSAPDEDNYSGNVTVSSPVIKVRQQSSGEAQTFSGSHGTSSGSNYSGPVVAIIVCIVILAIILFAMAVYFALYIRRTKPVIQ